MICDTCDGNGMTDDEEYCPDCDGTGEVEDDDEEDDTPPRKLTRQERLEGLADRGVDTWADYNEEN